MQSIVQNILLIILPLLGLTLPGVLKQDKFSPLNNAIISGVIVVLVSIAEAYTKDQFGPNFFLDAGVVLAGISALLGGPLRGLDAFLQGNVFALIQQQLPTIIQAVGALNAPTTQTSAPSNALIHITANTVHIPATAPAQQVTTSDVVVPDVVPVSDPVEPVQERAIAGDVVAEVTPVATGITTPDEANEKTQKIAVVKPTTPVEG